MVKERHSVAEKRQSVISNKRSSNLIHYHTQGAIHTLTVTVQVRGLATGDGIEEELYVCPPVKLQALVYDILPWRKVSESDARSLCALQSNSKHWFTTSFLSVCPPVWVSRKATLPGCCPQIKNNISFYVYDAVYCGPTDFVACSLAWRRQLCNRKKLLFFCV